MNHRSLIALSILTFSTLTTFAQAVDNNGAERNINKDHYVRLNYGNDYFTATDYYLTQTIFLEVASPVFKYNPLSYLMPKPKDYKLRYGLAAEHNGYTPTDYVPANILYGDRPFAATLSLKSFIIATDTLRHQRIATSISTGIIGPGAGGGEMQTYIHEHTPNAIPQGWPNQIANDLMLNYQVAYEKQIFNWSRYLNLSATAMARLGTISTKANVGYTLMAGLLDNPFEGGKDNHRRLRLYAYNHSEINAVGYDATLQGGLFNKESPYTLSPSAITRAVFRNNFGFVLHYQNLYLEYYQSYMTKEFSTGLEMHNGGIQIGIGL